MLLSLLAREPANAFAGSLAHLSVPFKLFSRNKKITSIVPPFALYYR